ncbi:MAG: AMP-binding protein [Gammaproteobacteria bacterium]|nr:AMP-binding protein [Gammaproteobacteria bacterium]
MIQAWNDFVPGAYGPTLLNLFSENVAAVSERRFVKTDKVDFSYGQMGRIVASIAKELPDDLPGRSVVFYMPNSASFIAAFYAVIARGGVPTPVNFAVPVAGVRQTISHFDVALAITAVPGISDGPELVLDDATLSIRADFIGELPANANPDDDAVHLFSGGTTGVPKRIRHSHRTLMATVERMEWCWPTEDGDVWLALAPFSHVWGLVMAVLNPQVNRCSLILPEKFHPADVVALMEEERVSVLGGGPPAIYQALLADETFADRDFSALRVCPGGGAPFPAAVHKRWTEATGVRIVEAVGMTEVAPISVNNDKHGPRTGTVGRPVPNTEVQVVDLNTGMQVMPPDMPGELRIRGPQMMLEYKDNPEETARTIRDGWIYSGDIGTMDADGYLTITDRRKDLIIHQGYNVFPREVEECVLHYPGVVAVGVVGVPDERSGERVVCYAVMRGNGSAEDIRAYCASELPGYKVPSEIFIVDELPMTPARKLDRVQLRALAKDTL